MSKPRIDLQNDLEDILGSCHVYFQPPKSVMLVYPCIIYSLSNDKAVYADDFRYHDKNRYTVTVVDKNPDSDIPNRLKVMQYCAFDRAYTADNLNHFVFQIYY